MILRLFKPSGLHNRNGSIFKWNVRSMRHEYLEILFAVNKYE